MKKTILAAVVLFLAVQAIVVAQPAPRPLYAAEVEAYNPHAKVGGIALRRTVIVGAADEADAERRARGGDANTQTKFIRWIPQAQYTAENYNAVGNGYFDRGNYKEAIAEYTKAIGKDSNYKTAYNNRAAAYNEIGEYDKAIPDANQAIRIDPKFTNAYTLRGVAYMKKGNYTQARADFEKAIDVSPSWSGAKKAREYLEELKRMGY